MHHACKRCCSVALLQFVKLSRCCILARLHCLNAKFLEIANLEFRATIAPYRHAPMTYPRHACAEPSIRETLRACNAPNICTMHGCTFARPVAYLRALLFSWHTMPNMGAVSGRRVWARAPNRGGGSSRRLGSGDRLGLPNVGS